MQFIISQTLGVALQRLPALILLDISSNDISDISLGQLVQPLTTYKEPLQVSMAQTVFLLPHMPLEYVNPSSI